VVVQIVPLAREQSFLGVGLAVVGAAGVPIAGFDGLWFIGSPALYATGLGAPLLLRRQLAVDSEPEGEAPYIPPLATVEEPWRTALRIVPTVLVAAAFLLVATVVTGRLAAPLGGVITGLGILELTAISGLSRWERRHDLTLYTNADWFVLARDMRLYQPRPR
jgi:hypothetical protein